MLKLFRKKNVTKIILWGLAIIIIPAFVLWGSGSLTKSKRQGPDYVGIVNGKKISFKDFFEHVAGTRCQLVLNNWNKPGKARAILNDRSRLARLAWQRLLFLEEARAQRISVSDQEVVTYIRRHPLFSKNGAFNRDIYEYALKYNFGLDARVFEEFLREFLQIVKLQARLTSGVRVNDEEVLKEYKRQREKVSIEYVLVNYREFVDASTVDEALIRGHYEAHKARYYIPEMVHLRYVVFDYAAYGGDRAAIIKAKEFAKGVTQALKDFARSAREASLTIHETGPFAYDDLSQDELLRKTFRDTAFAMQKNQTSDVIIPVTEDNNACYVIQVLDKIPRRQAQLIEARSKVIEELAFENAQAACKQFADDLSIKLTGAIEEGFSFKEASGNLYEASRKTPLFARNDILEDLGKAADLWDAAFTLAVGALSDPTRTAHGFCLFTPVAFERIDKAAFEKEKDTFTQSVLLMKKDAVLNEWFQGLASRTKLAVALDDIRRFR